MGGTLILLALTIATLLWADLTNGYVWVVLLITLGFGGIGLIDDYLKVTHRSSGGLRSRTKLLGRGAGRADRGGLDRVPDRGAAQHRARAAVPEGRAGPARAAVLPVRHAGHGRGLERGQPDRRSGRPRDRADHDRRRLLCADRVSGRQRDLRQLSRHPVRAGHRRARGVLRRHGRRLARLPVVQRAARHGVHGRHRLARLGRRARRGRGDHQARAGARSWSAACSCSRRFQ